jgi:hypothetical protein
MGRAVGYTDGMVWSPVSRFSDHAEVEGLDEGNLE